MLHLLRSVSYEMSQLRSDKAYINKHRRDEIGHTKRHGIEGGSRSLADSRDAPGERGASEALNDTHT